MLITDLFQIENMYKVNEPVNVEPKQVFEKSIINTHVKKTEESIVSTNKVYSNTHGKALARNLRYRCNRIYELRSKHYTSPKASE